MAGADRAINMPLRVVGLDGVKRDFTEIGKSGKAAFGEVESGANQASAAMNKVGKSGGIDGAARALDGLGKSGKTAAAGVGAANEGVTVIAPAAKTADVATEGLALRFGGLATAATLAGSALTIAASITVASAFAYDEHIRVLERFDTQLKLTGNQSGVTGDRMKALADEIVHSSLQTEKAVLDAAAALARVPNITPQLFEETLRVSAALADKLGTDVVTEAQKAADVLGPILAGDVDELKKKITELNPEIQLAVLRMVDAGDSAGAAAVLLDKLRAAAGNPSTGLSASIDRLGDSWNDMLTKWGETSRAARVVEASINGIGKLLDWLKDKADLVAASVAIALNPGNAALILMGQGPQGRGAPRPAATAKANVPSVIDRAFQEAMRVADQAELQARLYEPAKVNAPRSRSGGGDTAQRVLERQQREAEQAREAADRIKAANDEVVASYDRRAREALERLGKEGSALAEVQRQQAIDEAARRVSNELIDKEVEARRLAAKGVFDEAAARRAAAATVETQREAIRQSEATYYDASKAQEDFLRRMSEGRAIMESVRTPIEAAADEIARLRTLLAEGAVDATSFNRKMEEIAESMADAAVKGKEAWVGFGEDVGRTLSDIILNGGSARDILQELIKLPLERLLQQNIEQPVAKFIDKQFGVDRETNVAAARAQLPTAELDNLGVQAARAAIALAQISGMVGPAALGGGSSLLGGDFLTGGTGGALIDENGNRTAAGSTSLVDIDKLAAANDNLDLLAGTTGRVNSALLAQIPALGQFGTGIQQVLASLAGGGGGGGGFLNTLLSFGKVFAPSLAGIPSLGVSSNVTGAANFFNQIPMTQLNLPALELHGGGMKRDGRPRMISAAEFDGAPRLHDGTLKSNEFRAILRDDEHVMTGAQMGGLRTLMRDRGRRGPQMIDNRTIVQVNTPIGPDPRRTGSHIAAANQRAQARTAKKGIVR